MIGLIIELFKISFLLGLIVLTFTVGANLFKFGIDLFCTIIVEAVAFLGNQKK